MPTDTEPTTRRVLSSRLTIAQRVAAGAVAVALAATGMLVSGCRSEPPKHEQTVQPLPYPMTVAPTTVPSSPLPG